MAELCRQRNEMVMAGYALGQMSLDVFAEIQALKVKHNKAAGALRDSEDFEEAAAAYAKQLLGEAEAQKLKQALKEKVICTADHHGSLYCSQFLQSDLLFALIMEKLGERDLYVPILAAGQVELENSTYSRGLCAYGSKDNKQFLPLFPAKYSVQLATHAAPVTKDMTDRFRKRFVAEGEDVRQRQVLGEIMDTVYASEDVLNAKTFSEQTTRIEAKLLPHLFSAEAPSIVCLEMESVIQPLLLAELNDAQSLLYKMLYDRKFRKILLETKLPDGLTLGDNLFRAADNKGRKIMLSLTEEGKLTGTDWRKEPVCFETDPETLSALIQSRQLLPGVFTETLLLFFERGITWIGGMFQAVYLPHWQSALAAVLQAAGCNEEADLIRTYDCTGYSCGPMFILHKGDGFATTAGPVELWQNPVSFETVRQLAKHTSLWDAHLIGLSEMYFDLVLRDEREEDWYRKIAEELYQLCPQNMVTGDGK